MVAMVVTGGSGAHAENEATIDRLLANPTNTSTSALKQYLVTIVLMFGIGLSAVIAYSWLRPESDNDLVIAGIMTFVSTMLVAVIGLLKANNETHKLVNSEMAAFRAALRTVMVGTLETARLQGAADGSTRADERNETREDKIAATLAKAGAELVTVGKEKLAEIKQVTEGIHDTTKDTQQTVHKIAEVLPVKKET